MDAPGKESKEDLSGLYDLAIPLSMPITVIREMVEKFELDLVKRPGKMDMTGDPMDREILVFRGDLDTIMAARDYMFQALDRKLEEWDKRDHSQKYKKYYDEQVQERLEELKNKPKDDSLPWKKAQELI